MLFKNGFYLILILLILQLKRVVLYLDLKFKSQFEMMEDENCTQQFQQVYNVNKSQEDTFFDRIISELQQIVIDPQFESTLTNFMQNNWHLLQNNNSSQNLAHLHQQYQQLLVTYLQNNLQQRIDGFDWNQFWQMLTTRKHLIDEQILDTLQSLDNVEQFQAFIKDYKNSYDEEQQFKVLTIKSNKISENKKVKGKDNIFNNQGSNFSENGIKPLPKKKEIKEKTEAELLVPDLILTVKGMRKC